MDVYKAIDSIRVVREFDDRPVPDDLVRRIVNAGRRAGSSKNLQRWAFLIVRERDRLQRLSESGSFAQHVAGAALAIALVTPDPHAPDAPLSVTWDSGRAAQNMMLTAWELGIGSCPATIYQHDLVRDMLALPPERHCEYILSFGYPADPSVLEAPKQAGGRSRIDEVVHQERWEENP